MIRQYGAAIIMAAFLLFTATGVAALNPSDKSSMQVDPDSQALVEQMGQALDMTAAQQQLFQHYLQSQMSETRSYLEQLLTDEQLTELNRLQQQSQEDAVTETTAKPTTLVI